jgi:hypothetical protein
MGLDCTAYSRLKFIGEGIYDHDSSCYRDMRGVPITTHGDKYLCVESEEAENGSPQSQGLMMGIYTYSRRYDWRAGGNYTGYNLWRDQLACFAGYSPAIPQPGDRRASGLALVSRLAVVFGQLSAHGVQGTTFYEEVTGAYTAGAWDVHEGPFHELIN